MRKELFDNVLDLLYPPRCLNCDAPVGSNGSLCGDCWGKITFIGGALCRICGLPFPYDTGPDAICGDCARRHPDFDVARAALVYDDNSRGLVLSFKHGDRTFAANTYAHWMIRAGGDLLTDTDLVTPVPLHWTRLFSRRYNQAALLANIIGRTSGVKADVNLIRRQKRTASQGHKTVEQRRRNLQGAFAVPETRKIIIAGRSILLVDDVMTSGATVSACARILRRNGAGKVSVLTMARVVRTTHEF